MNGERADMAAVKCTGTRDANFRALPGVDAEGYGEVMRIHVDADKCQGHNRCYALAPELFDVDDYGNAVVIGDGTVSPELEDRARLAVANCPEFAISITE